MTQFLLQQAISLSLLLFYTWFRNEFPLKQLLVIWGHSRFIPELPTPSMVGNLQWTIRQCVLN